MSNNEGIGPVVGPVLIVLTAALLSAACATGPDTVGWPDVDVTGKEPVVDVDEPRLVRADNGLLFAVGEFHSPPAVGQLVFGRYGGPWPVEEVEPALFAGVVADIRGDRSVQVHSLYQFPETELDGLDVEFVDELGDETMGKGLTTVTEMDYSGPVHLDLALEASTGVSSGDMYAILRNFDGDSQATDAQLTRRLLGVCMVVEVEAESSRCRLREGHPDHKWAGVIEPGQQAIFLEPTFGTAPPSARVLVSTSGVDSVDRAVRDGLSHYLERFPGGAVTVEAHDDEADASSNHFYRWNRRIRLDEPGLFVGVSIEDNGRGEEHLYVNYAGLGTAIGPGMVAAPPEGGVDMGPVDELEEIQWRGLAATLMGAVLVYRGQNAEALSHLHDVLRDPGLRGPWRWHIRDQYAMRWAALDRYEEAIWLVLEDEELARRGDDDRAYYNALGTRTRLHDYLEQPEQALRAAREFLDAHPPEAGETTFLFARAMHAEMAAATEDFDEVEAALDELAQYCPAGCQGDLVYMLAGIYWALDDLRPDLQDRIVDTMVEVTRADEANPVAAVRMFQGWTFMRDDNFEQALMAFLEAERLYEREDDRYGASRALLFSAISQARLGNRQEAFERGLDVLEFMTTVSDYRATLRVYGQLSHLFLGIDPSERPGRYLAAAPQVLRTHLQARLSTGDYQWTSEAAFAYGVFMRFVGDFDQARQALQRGVIYGLRVAHLELVARCHVQLALVARQLGDEEEFEREIRRARLVAEAVDDPGLDDEIDQVVAPAEPEEPTQLL